jgi:hypothetical protein
MLGGHLKREFEGVRHGSGFIFHLLDGTYHVGVKSNAVNPRVLMKPVAGSIKDGGIADFLVQLNQRSLIY